MTRRPKQSDAPPPSGLPKPTFEEALGELEDIVQAMDGDRLPLNQLLEKYERGQALLKICQSCIDDAQQRVDLISSGKAGLSLQPFDPAAVPPGGAPPAPPSSVATADARKPQPPDDEIRLF